MSDTTHGLATAGVNQLIDLVDKTSGAAIESINQVRGAVTDVAGSAVDVTDAVSEDVINEINELRSKLVDRLRAVANAVSEPLKVLP